MIAGPPESVIAVMSGRKSGISGKRLMEEPNCCSQEIINTSKGLPDEL